MEKKRKSFYGKTRKSIEETNPSPAAGNSSFTKAPPSSESVDNAENTNTNIFSNFLSSKTNVNTQLTDKLIEKFVLRVLPTENASNESNVQQRIKDSSTRPQFSVPIMSNNFINMNSRLSIPFITLNQIISILNWENFNFNVFLLIMLTHLILNPLPILLSSPLIMLMYGVMIPQYLKKYPVDINFKSYYNLKEFPYPSYKPLKNVEEVKPCNQLSKEFFLNLTDLQNFMVIYILAWDFINNFLKKFIYFKFEAFSNFIFVSFFFSTIGSIWFLPSILLFCLPVIKVALIVLVWYLMIMLHPNNRQALISMLDVDGYLKEVLKVEKQSLNEEDKGPIKDSSENKKSLDKLKEKIKPNKKKIYTNITPLLHGRWYLNFINSEFNYKQYADTLENNLKLVGVFELQIFNKFDNSWSTSIFSIDPFPRNCEIRKTYISNQKNKSKTSKFIKKSKSSNKNTLKSKNDSTLQNATSNYSLSSYLADLSTDSITNTVSSFVAGDTSASVDQEVSNSIVEKSYDDSTDWEIRPKVYAEKVKDFLPPKGYKFRDSKWKLELIPENWVNDWYLNDLVIVHDDSKWVYDTDATDEDNNKSPEKEKVKRMQFRRRLWFRYVERVSDYNEDYDGIDYDVFKINFLDSADTANTNDEQTINSEEHHVTDSDGLEGEDYNKTNTEDNLIDHKTKNLKEKTELFQASKHPHKRSESFADKIMSFI